jgi:hypothetical protein
LEFFKIPPFVNNLLMKHETVFFGFPDVLPAWVVFRT